MFPNTCTTNQILTVDCVFHFRSLSQNSSVLPEEEDEKSCSESDASRLKHTVDQQEVCKKVQRSSPPCRISLKAVDVYIHILACISVCEGSCPAGLIVLQCGVTPDSENLTLSSSGAIDQSSCTGTPLSSTIASPEGKHNDSKHFL